MLNEGGDVDLKLVNMDTNKSCDVSLKKVPGKDTYLFDISDEIKLPPRQEIKLRYDNNVIHFYLI